MLDLLQELVPGEGVRWNLRPPRSRQVIQLRCLPNIVRQDHEVPVSALPELGDGRVRHRLIAHVVFVLADVTEDGTALVRAEACCGMYDAVLPRDLGLQGALALFAPFPQAPPGRAEGPEGERLGGGPPSALQLLDIIHQPGKLRRPFGLLVADLLHPVMKASRFGREKFTLIQQGAELELLGMLADQAVPDFQRIELVLLGAGDEAVRFTAEGGTALVPEGQGPALDKADVVVHKETEVEFPVAPRIQLPPVAVPGGVRNVEHYLPVAGYDGGAVDSGGGRRDPAGWLAAASFCPDDGVAGQHRKSAAAHFQSDRPAGTHSLGGLSPAGFAALMWAPSLAAVLVPLVFIGIVFRRDLRKGYSRIPVGRIRPDAETGSSTAVTDRGPAMC
ncbi:MAG: arsenic transporter [Pseudarthrobacter sp.]|nr:arsenic transporter [Pseudarthrobacter sp.]